MNDTAKKRTGNVDKKYNRKQNASIRVQAVGLFKCSCTYVHFYVTYVQENEMAWEDHSAYNDDNLDMKLSKQQENCLT